jgi:carrier-protein-independent halogenase WelO5-like protein
MSILPGSTAAFATHERPTGRWARGVQYELTRANLLALATGDVPAIHLRRFIDNPAAEAIGRVFDGLVHGYYRDVVPRITKCGPTVFEHEFAARGPYFAEARATDEVFSHAMAEAGAVSPWQVFERELRERCGLSFARASDRAFGDYFAGTLRSMDAGTPVHIDFAPYEAPGWEMISSVDAQLSANVYLDATGDEGSLVIYDHLWTPEDERFRFGDRFGYDDAVVEGERSVAITPATGDLVLFNSRFFHRVQAPGHRRLTYSFFFAVQDDRVIAWS